MNFFILSIILIITPIIVGSIIYYGETHSPNRRKSLDRRLNDLNFKQPDRRKISSRRMPLAREIMTKEYHAEEKRNHPRNLTVYESGYWGGTGSSSGNYGN